MYVYDIYFQFRLSSYLSADLLPEDALKGHGLLTSLKLIIANVMTVSQSGNSTLQVCLIVHALGYVLSKSWKLLISVRKCSSVA